MFWEMLWNIVVGSSLLGRAPTHPKCQGKEKGMGEGTEKRGGRIEEKKGQGRKQTVNTDRNVEREGGDNQNT